MYIKERVVMYSLGKDVKNGWRKGCNRWGGLVFSEGCKHTKTFKWTQNLIDNNNNDNCLRTKIKVFYLTKIKVFYLTKLV